MTKLRILAEIHIAQSFVSSGYSTQYGGSRPCC